MKWETFHSLWHTAREVQDKEQFIAENACFVEGMTEEDAYRWLDLIHQLSNSDPRNLRAVCGLTQHELQRRFDVPMSTSNKWDCVIKGPVPWTHMILAYAMLSDMLSV